MNPFFFMLLMDWLTETEDRLSAIEKELEYLSDLHQSFNLHGPSED